jgi:hypothetical protein
VVIRVEGGSKCEGSVLRPHCDPLACKQPRLTVWHRHDEPLLVVRSNGTGA